MAQLIIDLLLRFLNLNRLHQPTIPKSFNFLVHHLLVSVHIFFKARAPVLTVYKSRLLLARVLPMPTFDVSTAIRMVWY